MLQLLLASGTMALVIVLVVYQIYRIRELRYHGKRVIALVTSIRHETGKTEAGFARDNYYVTATWTNPRTGRTYWGRIDGRVVRAGAGHYVIRDLD